MLDSVTRRRIDTARDILVGKVPDPKSQVEQITIALVYKFMDDMDAEAEELGGNRSFFAGEYARYGWAKLMRSGLGGHETLNLYAEAIGKMPENPGIPPLFRDIFKNAFLPYRDPETLRAFLKVIDEFEYDHSERLGDAFEYLLSVLGSQGDAGQFRTPRHIIDFIVAILDPKKHETVLDPACGTAGFLISAYKHIMRANSSPDAILDTGNGDATAALDSSRIPPARGDLLTPDERAWLATNFKGYDISPDMVRLSLVNMYLHGFSDPHIYEYDTLTSDERWNEHADVILANPPFMTPTGGIRPHNRFTVQSKRSEVLFVDYMAEHLTPNGRAGIIVPEGVIFNNQKAYKALRRMLVEGYLVAAVSLPAGVFKPYSDVKTTILILDRALAQQADSIAFFKVENDGFALNDQRRPIDLDDLPQARTEITEYLRGVRERQSLDDFEPTLGLVVPKEQIAGKGDYNLSGERYRVDSATLSRFPRVRLSEVCDINPETATPAVLWPGSYFSYIDISCIENETGRFLGANQTPTHEAPSRARRSIRPGDILLSTVRPNLKAFALLEQVPERAIASTGFAVLRAKPSLAAPGFLIAMLRHDVAVAQMVGMSGKGAYPSINQTDVESIEIPLPPLEVQQEIAAEIEGYQKVIDGARAVISNYRPHIPTDPDWPLVHLEEVANFISGGTPSKANGSYWSGEIPWVSAKDLKVDRLHDAAMHISQRAVEESATAVAPPGSLLVLVRGMGLANGVPIAEAMTPCAFNQDLKAIVPKSELVDSTYLAITLRQQGDQFERVLGRAAHGTMKLDTDDLKAIEFPLPRLETQRAIVAEIESEQALVNANRELVSRMEQKIEATLARVWGEEEPAAAEAPQAAEMIPALA